MGRRSAICVLVIGLTPALVAPASAQVQLPAKPQTASLDSEAPPGAPPHWLPGEQWVMQHWLPYDEQRLYRLLGVTRGDVWRMLRDDTRTIAQLAESKGIAPRTLARRLVAPWRGHLQQPRRLKLLETRALRTLTQGHLAQHMLFHSLHQNAIPDNAPAIFGTASRAEFQRLRRSELSPLQICRLNGFSRAHAQGTAVRTLRAKAAQAVAGQAMPAAQARRLLDRQLRQVPRWLQQTRYNGPPPLKQPRTSIATASNYSNNAALSEDGRQVVYESYEAKLPMAKTRGEIGVLTRDLALTGGPEIASGPEPGPVRPTPSSAYNPAVSADGRWVAFESAEGNLNFAKRYGQMDVFVRDLRRGLTLPVTRAPGQAPRSAYNPTVSGDGRWVAYESSESGRGRLEVWAQDLRSGRALRIERNAYEPSLAPSGRRLAYTAVRDGRSQVLVRDLRSGATQVASGGEGEAYEPVLSRSGRFVAYTSTVSGRGRVYVRDLARATTTLVAPLQGDGLADGAAAFEPSLSGDGGRVAFVARDGARRTRVYVRDLRSQSTTLVSRATGAQGVPASGDSAHPAISGDGRRVAFTSDAFDLSPEKCNSARGVFVRDLDRASTRVVSRGDGANRYIGPTRGSSTSTDMLVTLLCA